MVKVQRVSKKERVIHMAFNEGKAEIKFRRKSVDEEKMERPKPGGGKGMKLPEGS